MVIETVGTPRVVLVELGGDVQIEGWDRAHVAIEVDDEGVPAVETVDGAIHIHAGDDVTISVPRDTVLDVPQAPGDVSVRSVHGALALGRIEGEVELSDVGTVALAAVAGDVAIDRAAGEVRLDSAGGDVALRGGTSAALGTVGGDLAVDGLSGELSVRIAGGDAAVRNVAGAVVLERVGADLVVGGLGGDLRATAGADAALDLAPRPGGHYTVTAGAAIRCRLPEDAAVEVSATSGTGTVRVAAPGQGNEPVGGVYTASFGDGGARLDLVAGSSVYLRLGQAPAADEAWGELGAEFANDFARWADEFADRMRVHAVRVSERVGERLSRVAATMPDVLVAAGMSADEAERIAERVQRAAERAAERVQEKSERMAQRAERHVERAERWAERQASRAASRAATGPAGIGGRRPEPPSPPRPPAPPMAVTPAVSSEERLMVLRLLEEGKITVDEAERLLNTLGMRGA